MTPPNSCSTNQFGKNTVISQQKHQSVILIDSNAKPQTKECLLDIITELKNILKEAIQALS